MSAAAGERTRLWHAAELGGVELLHARYVQQRFARVLRKATLPGTGK
jgi:hypothetical protein